MWKIKWYRKKIGETFSFRYKIHIQVFLLLSCIPLCETEHLFRSLFLLSVWPFAHMSVRRAPISQIRARRCSCTASSWRFPLETSKRGFSSCLTSFWSTARRKTGDPSCVHYSTGGIHKADDEFKFSLRRVFLSRDGMKILFMLIHNFPSVSVLLQNI